MRARIASDIMKTGRRAPPGRLREALLGYALVAPLVGVVAVLVGYQFVRLIAISFADERVGMAPGTTRFVGLENYGLILHFPDFPRMVANTLLMTGVAVAAEIVLGMLAALALNERLRGRALYRAVLFLPWVIPGSVAVVLWRWIFDVPSGILNALLVGQLHLRSEPVVVLASPVLALPAIILVLVWRGTPFCMVLLIGALQTVPSVLYEAAKVDGANAWQRCRHVTLPQVQRVVAIAAILATVWTVGDFTVPYGLTLGGPGNATNVVAFLTYVLATRGGQTSEAATIIVLFLPIVAAMVVILTRFLGRPSGEV
jgi:ABC-type sugar transport system permease subunit